MINKNNIKKQMWLLNSLIIFLFPLFIEESRKWKNILYSFLLSSFFMLENLSYAFFNTPIRERFIFFILNLKVFTYLLTTNFVYVYFCFIFFFLFWYIIYLLFTKINISKYRKYVFTFILIIELTPLGYIYEIIKIPVDYSFGLYKYRNYTAETLFEMVKNEKYISKNNLKVEKQKYSKNLVLIYLESYEMALLTNDKISPYTKNIMNIANKYEFYNNVPQLDYNIGTANGLISTQCGLVYNTMFAIKNPLAKVNKNTKLVCLGDILHLSNYKQIYVGGAERSIFNKDNFYFSHNYDEVYGLKEIKKERPYFNSCEWGICDIDLIEFAKDKYKMLEATKQPFNLTLLTSSTHNPSGTFDSRCPNTTSNNLLNAIECTDKIISEFIDFLIKQKSFDDTIIVVLPDHIQFNWNDIKDILNKEKKSLYLIIIEKNKHGIITKKIDYTDFVEILIPKLGIKTNANFLKAQDDIDITNNFLYKID